jgi:hypothetical protein
LPGDDPSQLRFIDIDGKRYAWKEILRLRRERIAAAREKQQPTLFKLRRDRRPPSQQNVRGRHEEPSLFKVDLNSHLIAAAYLAGVNYCPTARQYSYRSPSDTPSLIAF